MSTGTLIFVLLVVGMVGVHLFGHSRRGTGAAGGGHGMGGCCGGHGHGGHETEGSGRRSKPEPEQVEPDSEPAQPVASERAPGPRPTV